MFPLIFRGRLEEILKKIIPASRFVVSLSDDYPLAQGSGGD